MAIFTYSKMTSATKPASAANGWQSMSNYIVEDLTIAEIAKKISEGHAWRNAIHKMEFGNFKTENAIGGIILALDFDICDATAEEVAAFAEEQALPPNFYYYSYSHGIKEKNNFRIVWLLEHQMDKSQFTEAIINLRDKFIQFNPDKATKNLDRLWYGTNKEVIVCSEQPLHNGYIARLAVDKGNAEGRRIGDITKAKKSMGEWYRELPTPEDVYVKRGWWERLRGVCPLWDMWEGGEYMEYPDRLNLYANIRYLKYSSNNIGSSVFSDFMSFFNEDAYKGHMTNRNEPADKFRETTYKPHGIVLVKGVRLTVSEYMSYG